MKIIQKIVKYYKKIGIAYKYFILSFISTLILFSILFTITLKEVEKLFVKQNEQYSQNIVMRANDFLDIYMDNIKNITFMMASNKDLFQDDNRDRTYRLLRKYVENNATSINMLHIITTDGKIFSSGQTLIEIMGHPVLYDIYELSMKHSGRIIWSEPYYSRFVGGNTIAFSMDVKDEYRNEIGVVIVEIKLDYLLKRLESLLDNRGEALVILSNNGNPIVYSLDNNLLEYVEIDFKQVLDMNYVNEIRQMNYGVNYTEFLNKPQVIVRSHANSLGWEFYLAIDTNNFYNTVGRLYDYFGTIAVIWIGVLFFSSFFLSKYFTNPIQELVAKLDSIRRLEQLKEINSSREDEIGSLIESYNHLVKRILTLTEDLKKIERKKKESDLKMLQSQIGPHFLYNTLACIENLAKMQKLDEVSQTIKSLVGLFSLSFDKHSDFITIKDEIRSLDMNF